MGYQTEEKDKSDDHYFFHLYLVGEWNTNRIMLICAAAGAIQSLIEIGTLKLAKHENHASALNQHHAPLGKVFGFTTTLVLSLEFVSTHYIFSRKICALNLLMSNKISILFYKAGYF